ncbi:MAG: hypothetical protein NTZ17_00695 [Phycisphaerae bacterium]|nr:hypothetical protein [Phycisphaerae bacterium]
MNRSKRVGMLLVGVLLWAGLCLLGPQTPLAGERQAAKPGDREARALPPAGSVDLRCQTNQPTTILSVIPPGKSVKKGDLLVELDVSALVDKRIQQVRDVKKAESEMILTTESQDREKRAAGGQVGLAEKALRLAQAQLKAFIDGEYPHQLALAQSAAALAEQKRLMAEERVLQLRARERTQEGQTSMITLQEAEIALQEARLQSTAAQGSLVLLKSAVHDNKVAELELVVAQREFDLARAQDAVSAAAARGAVTVSLAEMNHRTEAHRLAKLDDQITQCRIYAPQDGTVVYPNDPDGAAIRPDAVVRERQVLIRLLPVTPPKP